MATHKSVQGSKSTAFDFGGTLEAIVTKYNSLVPVSKGATKGQARKADATIVFNATGRGRHPFSLLAAAMGQFGADASKVTAQQIADELTKRGYLPAVDGKVVKVSPVKGMAVNGGGASVSTSELAAFGIPGLADVLKSKK